MEIPTLLVYNCSARTYYALVRLQLIALIHKYRITDTQIHKVHEEQRHKYEYKYALVRPIHKSAHTESVTHPYLILQL